MKKFCEKSFSGNLQNDYDFFEIFQVNFNVQKGKTINIFIERDFYVSVILWCKISIISIYLFLPIQR